ncbi:MAG TPA: hypothetical protein VFH48_42745 [Chloroflexota bacterium]|nr:hypothetical protein [Chloroflexota bacterium]
MNGDHGNPHDPRVQQAVEELSRLILASYPQATLTVRPHPEEPSTTLLVATVDVEDLDEVLDVVFERMEQLRIDNGVPVLVLPVHPVERTISMLEGRLEDAQVVRTAVP